jgi:tRNA dimethylallyltransferase
LKFENQKGQTLGQFRTILIAGPTASGKSGLAITLAQRHNGVIVNTDSMQVYNDLTLITARPSLDEESQAPHRLYGDIDAGVAFSTGAWLRAVGKILPQLRNDFETVIFVGGTGLYFNALTMGLSEIPEIPELLQQHLRNELETLGPAALFEQLQIEDAISAATLEPTDGQRIIRALGVIRHTGKSLKQWQKVNSAALVDTASPLTKAIVLDPDRDWVSKRIEQRFHQMVANGALDEVSALIKRGLEPKLPAMKAIGVAELASYLAHQSTLEAAINAAVIASRQYAKRQRTWFRGQMNADWVRFSTPEINL